MAPNDQTHGGETETFIHQRRLHQKSTWQNLKEFVWDPVDKKFLSRTCISWLEITIFYIIFYAFLVGFWATCLAGFVLTLNDEAPRYYGKGSIIGINPGMGYQPWLKEDPASTLIYINKADSKSYAKYVKRLNEFVDKRFSNISMTRKCVGDDNNAQLEEQMSCRFDTDEVWGSKCNAANDWGFAEGKPCILLSLNRLIGWQPMAYPLNSEPEAIRGRYQPGDVAIDCRGANPADREHIGDRSYMPESGLQGKYFPYRVMANYHQPMALVKFNDPPVNTLVQVECLAYAYNIIHDAFDRQGLIHFELLIDDHEAVEEK